jgi:hypothetical protein
MTIRFFVIPAKLLDLTDQGSAYSPYSPVVDAVVCKAFYLAVQAVASKFDLDYMTARAKLVELYKYQQVFSFYGICSHALEGSGYVSEELTKFALLAN